MIVADQWRADSVGYDGNKVVQTPELDQLANEGVAFSNAYCQNPVCVPSRSSFLTGWYPHTNGYRTMHHLMGDDQPNLLKTLKNNGYHVYWGGRNDFLKIDADHSKYYSTRSDMFYEKFKAYRDKKKNSKDTVKEKPEFYTHAPGVKEKVVHPDVDQIEDAIEFINTKGHGDDPFCIYLALALPHPPYTIEPEWFDKFDLEDIPDPIKLTEEQWSKKPSLIQGIYRNQNLYNLPDEELKKIKQIYYAMGTKLDHYIGNLVDTLKAQGVYDDTVFVFFSDHGDYTGDYQMVEKNQNTFEDCLTRVPLVIKPAKDIDFEPRKTDALVELIDVQATIMDLLGIEPEHTHFGKSLREVLTGKENEHRDVVFCEGGRLEGEAHAMDAGHTPDNEYWARTTEQEKMPQHTKAMMIRDHEYKYVYRLYEDDEFYDLKADPEERDNKIDDPLFSEKIQQFKNRMLRHFFETGDVVPFKQDKRF
ncbi:sulfatase-like hydrolase/transferase [Amphibacillus sediminis]|uniref:sulfatase-like hydrolase/transferase n=1 Tax=Amphibacillus sediminis TaxID=360185 RepID=UPI001FDEA94D|nr:sulfatase-like hydrolase/transferase [Amphibacillus sediminis]